MKKENAIRFYEGTMLKKKSEILKLNDSINSLRMISHAVAEQVCVCVYIYMPINP